MTSSIKIERVDEFLRLLRAGEVSAAHRPASSIERRLRGIDPLLKMVYSPIHGRWILLKKTRFGFYGIVLEAPSGVSAETAASYFESALRPMSDPDLEEYYRWVEEQAYKKMKALEKKKEEWRLEQGERIDHIIRKAKGDKKITLEVHRDRV